MFLALLTVRPALHARVSDEVVALAGRVVIIAAVAMQLLPSPPAGGFARVAGVAFVAVMLGRASAYAAVRAARHKGTGLEPAAVVGAGPVAVKLAGMLVDRPEYGLRPVGFIDTVDDGDLPLPLLGPVSELDAIARRHGLRHVIVAYGATTEHELVPALRSAAVGSLNVHVVPRLFELGVPLAGRSMAELWGTPLMTLQPSAPYRSTWRIKRAVDICAAALLLVLAAPVLLAAALAVRLSSPGPVLFRQERVGRDGQRIEIFKFRTLLVNGDSDTTWSVDNDERRTPVGNLLRSTHLDELPQLFNVLRGDMSLVGPRPERPFFVDRFRKTVPAYTDRLRVPAGLTGWAQVHGLRGDTSIDERARFDNFYIEHWSLWRDVVILFRTLRTVVNSRG